MKFTPLPLLLVLFYAILSTTTQSARWILHPKSQLSPDFWENFKNLPENIRFKILYEVFKNEQPEFFKKLLRINLLGYNYIYPKQEENVRASLKNLDCVKKNDQSISIQADNNVITFSKIDLTGLAITIQKGTKLTQKLQLNTVIVHRKRKYAKDNESTSHTEYGPLSQWLNNPFTNSNISNSKPFFINSKNGFYSVCGAVFPERQTILFSIINWRANSSTQPVDIPLGVNLRPENTFFRIRKRDNNCINTVLGKLSDDGKFFIECTNNNQLEQIAAVSNSKENSEIFYSFCEFPILKDIKEEFDEEKFMRKFFEIKKFKSKKPTRDALHALTELNIM